MSAILRITKAELIKIFKKPSVYIMGFILALVLVATAFSFTPSTGNIVSANITGNNANNLYSAFYSSDGVENKSYYDTSLQQSNDKLSFYINLTNKNNGINNAYATFITAIESLENAVSNNFSENDKLDAYNEVIVALHDLESELTDDYALSTNATYATYLNSDHYKKYYNTEQADFGFVNLLLQVVDDPLNLNNNADSFIQYYNTNFIDIESDQHLLNGLKQNMVSAVLTEKYDNLETAYVDYHIYFLQLSSNSVDANLQSLRDDLEVAFYNFELMLEQIFDSVYPIALIDSQDLNDAYEYMSYVSNLMEDFNAVTASTEYDKHKALLESMDALQLMDNAENIVNSIDPIVLDDDYLSDIYNNVTALNNSFYSMQTNLVADIEQLYTQVSNNLNTNVSMYANQMHNYLNAYKWLSIAQRDYIDDTLTLHITRNYNDLQIVSLEGYSNYNAYKLSENISKTQYFLDNETYGSDYLNTYAFNERSGSYENIYDYIFFGLKVSSIIIILFSIIMASNIMASEYNDGTMKLLAIRPFKRTKILTGKLLSTIFFTIIFVLYSLLITIIAGLSLSLPFVSNSVLVVFNASNVFTINALLLMFINVGSIMLEVLFYTIVALAISSMFKSFAGAFTTSIIILFSGFTLNSLYANKVWYSLSPFANTDFFRFLGSNISYNNNNILTTLLNNKLLSGANIYVSCGIYVATLSFILVMAYINFKNKDI